MNIKKDKEKGTYYFVISAGFRPDGKRRQVRRTGFTTQKEAKEAYLKIQHELNDEKFVNPSSVTLQSYMEKWQKRKKIQVEGSTFNRYNRVCQNNIIPYIGHLKLQKIAQITIQELIDDLAGNQGLSRSTCLMITTILKDVFRNALKEGIVSTNPVEDIDLPKTNRHEMLIWDQESIDKFISLRKKKNRGQYYMTVLTALFTGMRKGEVLGLTWDKINFDNNTILVNQILESDGSKISKRTKNKKFRTIMMPELLKQELLSHRKIQTKTLSNNPDNLVFCTRNGKVVFPKCINDSFVSICRKHELPIIKFHDLRHTHATMLIRENVNIKVIQERLGHTRASMTLDVYSHVLPSMQQTVTNKLNEIYSCD